MLLPTYLSMVLSKEQILAFLGLPRKTKMAKKLLVAMLHERVCNDQVEMIKLLNMYPYELAVEPAELETLLGCSRTERRRWVKEGKLPVLEYRSFRRAGSDLLYPVHDRRVVLEIQPEEVAYWRNEYNTGVRERRKLAGQAAVEKRRENKQTRQQFFSSWEQTVTDWRVNGSPELATVFQLAYWTVWASRWAKQNQVMATRSTKKAAVYADKKENWYALKNEALCLLSRTAYSRLSFYRPPQPDKCHLWLCEMHFELKCEGYYENIWEFFGIHADMVRKCPDCHVSEEKDYYSLYHLEVSSSRLPGVQFSFHLPYPVGVKWFPAPGRLPQVQHMEQDGMFRFGRPVLQGEKITHRENDVLAFLKQALEEVRALIGVKENAQEE